uniref:Delta(9) fatty acid conjugase-like enzyme n=1 Tax=Dimorphotheca sinuata TaxID=112408 RepID=FAD22_DIMSI|nr:RecName: Full=Delta(9) fatty acid conjugase-like enzyme; AltName: Full=Fatty acid desaturase 2-2; Short=DsFAD2-2 [Dimorphotheca sinuata]AAS72901.1 delta9 fatty acid conjugase-like enzyme [Dimorphotheca sinuata]
MGASEEMKVLERVPVSKPPFEYNDLKKAVPPHCFTRSLSLSFYYLFYDLIKVCILFYVASKYIPMLPYSLSCIVWPLYWFFQGAFLGRLWMIGHECGHHSFSNYRWLDDTVGFLVHTATLTPYFSFKYSHRNHHAHTNSLEYDEVHVPKIRKFKSEHLYSEFLTNNPFGLVVNMVFELTFGYPSYLIFNYSGRKLTQAGFASHLYPQSPIFNDSERNHVFFSDVGICIVLYALYRIAIAKGAMLVLYVYGLPWVVMSAFIFSLTYLQHTHPSIPHYDSTEWNWLRGALSSIDRELAGAFNIKKTHYHVVHHLFPFIPEYHAHDATEALKPILGPYYKYDGTPFYKALWREMKDCLYVESDDGPNKTGVYWFKTKT